MSDPTDHTEYEALAAGYALHALEPEDEQQLSVHLLTCSACARLVADTAALGSAFTGLLGPEEPPPGLRERILAAAAAEPRRTDVEVVPAEPVTRPARSEAVTPPVVIARPGRPRRRVRERFLVGALAAAIGVGVAVPVTLAASNHGASSTTNDALAQALLQANAHEVTLKGTTGTSLAKAVLSDQGVYLLADGLPVNDRSRSVYVLWAANAAGQRQPVATFDVRSGSPVQLTASKLPFSSTQIHQLAISYEPGRSAPTQPSDVVLSGSTA
ncbi:MAG TPA: anti-sigma factor [Frankiaceae bacterium]|jgi:anti-sigma factor RsiW|nr:anti-sigma factor [Frankiaceae bacterium]